MLSTPPNPCFLSIRTILLLAGIGLGMNSALPCVYAEPTSPSVSTLLAKLSSNQFSERALAQRELAQRTAQAPEDLLDAYVEASPEVRSRIRQLLEGVMLAYADERGDRAEKTLMALEDFGSPTAQSILIGNSRLRESRAKVAIERLGGDLSFVHPATIRFPSPTVPVMGVGFGDPSVLATILIPEDWTGTTTDLWQFERLAQHQNLVIYNIRGNQVSLDDLLPLSSKLVGLQVVVRGACLGIEAISGSPIAEVSAVVEKSAAAAAGIRPYDQIVKLDETPVRNFNHLVELLAEFRPGDNITLEVRRNEKLLTLPVTLASWKTVLRRELRAVAPPTPFAGPLGFGTPVPPEMPTPLLDHRQLMNPENN